MEVTKQNIQDIDSAISILNQRKSKLVLEKKELELKNSTLKNQVRSGGRMHDVKYKRVCDEQNSIKIKIFSIEREMADLSIEMMKKQSFRDQLKAEFKHDEPIDIKKKLVHLRDEYINFAADKSRVSSMRVMGAEFAEKLETLIKSI